MDDLDRLRDFLGDEPKILMLPIAGVYFLFQDEILVYIGMSYDIAARVGHHVAHHKTKFNRAFYIEEPNQARRSSREAELIGSFNPILNVQNTPKKARKGTGRKISS